MVMTMAAGTETRTGNGVSASRPVSFLGSMVANSIGASQGGVVPLQEVERQAIQQALTYTRGDRTTAAQLLGIGRTTLYRKLKGYGYPPAGRAAHPQPLDQPEVEVPAALSSTGLIP